MLCAQLQSHWDVVHASVLFALHQLLHHLTKVWSSFCSDSVNSRWSDSSSSGLSKSSSKSLSAASTDTNFEPLKPSTALTTYSSTSSYMSSTFLSRFKNCSMYGDDIPVWR